MSAAASTLINSLQFLAVFHFDMVSGPHGEQHRKVTAAAIEPKTARCLQDRSRRTGQTALRAVGDEDDAHRHAQCEGAMAGVGPAGK